MQEHRLQKINDNPAEKKQDLVIDDVNSLFPRRVVVFCLVRVFRIEVTGFSGLWG